MKHFSFRLVSSKELEKHQGRDRDYIWDTEKEDFIATATHQLRTPLAGIKWTLNMLIKEESEGLRDDHRKWLLVAFESNERIIKMVDSILNALRVQEGAVLFEASDVQVVPMFRSIIKEQLATARKKNVDIDLSVDEEIPLIRGDEQKLRVAFENIVNNGIKYSSQGGEVKVAITKEESNLKISVSDKGIGIPDDEQKNVFKRFFRANNAMKTVKDGSGLGLFISKSVIEKHSGQIWFKSLENKGSTFYAVLPFNGLR